MKSYWSKAVGVSVASIALALGSACMAEGSESLQSFACNGDVAGAAAAILLKHKEGVGDQTKIPLSTDGVKEVLAVMRQGDQDIRLLAVGLMGRCGLQADSATMQSVMSTGRTIDEVNRDVLKGILREKGWPVISIYGEQADQSAFLIAQHADRDPAFQKLVLKVLELKYRDRETSGENYALLFDRVRVAKAKLQRYGSQGECHGKNWVPNKIENAAKVDTLREVVGLEPLAEYRKKVARVICAGETG